jgi:hypothetical protein
VTKTSAATHLPPLNLWSPRGADLHPTPNLDPTIQKYTAPLIELPSTLSKKEPRSTLHIYWFKVELQLPTNSLKVELKLLFFFFFFSPFFNFLKKVELGSFGLHSKSS